MVLSVFELENQNKGNDLILIKLGTIDILIYQQI